MIIEFNFNFNSFMNGNLLAAASLKKPNQPPWDWMMLYCNVRGDRDDRVYTDTNTKHDVCKELIICLLKCFTLIMTYEVHSVRQIKEQDFYLMHAHTSVIYDSFICEIKSHQR